MRAFREAALAFTGILMVASSATSAPPLVALVEHLDGNPVGVEIMDYVEAGKVIRLGARDRIVLGYMTSCIRETITGGTVTIGTDKSEVQSGEVERISVECDARTAATVEQTSQIAGRVFRGPTLSSVTASAQLTIYGASPMLELTGPGVLTIERIDQIERYAVQIEKEQLVRGKFYDFAQWGRVLSAGGTYRVAMDAKHIVFAVAPNAKPGPAPIVSRLLRLVSSN
jgi:hypothetical protein